MGFLDFLKPKNNTQTQQITSILPKDIYRSAVLELKDIIAPSALKISPKTLNLGEKLVRSFFVMSYPKYLSDSWFSPIINLDKAYDISIFIHPIDTSVILNEFKKKVAEVQSQISDREEKGLVRDPQL
ncbi:conjugal transfer protein TraC, partial [Candidatus Parcubacteria bacterium]|nr:conjugal transfer protein TraC [Candidatus Parcubacteria bacterium]